ncbi:MAG: 1-acyl-sn-glycerol-3-phosphate acyltransferase [Gemmatimonadota bacterium]|nr:MAG: 1-acyl-sn-glycerol-3-phosphate acyltransferase [Gemmatimonadota bacterium]
MAILGRVIVRSAVRAAAIYYRAERAGRELPPGPVVIVTNHPNMLMDPLLAMWAAARRVRVLAKAPLFDIPVFGRILRSVDTLPLYRVQDDPDQLPRNRLAFQEACDTLSAGGTLLTFPEGKSHTSPRLAALKTGAARIALAGEEVAGWGLGVQIVPIGLAYERKQRFRSEVVATLGKAIVVADWRIEYESGPASAIRSLTKAIALELEAATLNFVSNEDRELSETADLVSARRGARDNWRTREPFVSRLPRLRRLAELFGWLRTCQPDRHALLARRLRSYRQRLVHLGARTGDVPPERETGGALRALVGGAAVLGLAVPIAALGAIAWFLPVGFARVVRCALRPPVETVATVEYLAGFVAVPVTYVAWVAGIAKLWGAPGALVVALALPAAGFATLSWWRRARELWENLGVYARTLGRPRLRRRLEVRRSKMVAELGRLATEWQAAAEHRVERPVA